MIYALCAVVALAFAVEGALGFGATVVAMALGAFLVPVHELLPAFVPLNMVLSLSIVIRDRKHVDAGVLLKRIAPLMLLGLPLGMLGARVVDGALLTKVYGGLVAVLGLVELVRRGPAQSKLTAPLFFLAGVVHGAFGTGGPLVVYALGTTLTKPALRATLAALWFSLNVILVTGFALDGRMQPKLSAELFLPLVVGLVVGELVHRKLTVDKFRAVVWAGLVVAGVALALR